MAIDAEKRIAGRQNANQPERKGWLQSLGPGLVTGASDDDPSGIASYSQVGAQFGFQMLWTMLFSYPLLAGIQEISAQMGRVTGRGIAGNLRKYYPAPLVYIIVVLMLGANTANLGADIAAMGAAAAMLIGGPAVVFSILLAATSLLLQVFSSYEHYSSVLKWMTLALLAYVATAFVVHIPWASALAATVVPQISLKTDFITGLVAVLGTTISPYLFFWQSAEEVEIEKAAPDESPLKEAPGQAPSQLHRIRVDTYSGMAISNIIAIFIMLTAAATLHAHGITDIQTANQAATALRPIAGRFASVVFACGLIGSGMLAVPVMAGSAAYAIGEVFGWPVGLARKPLQARGFYGVLVVSMLLGLGLTLVRISPIKALFWSAVLNGLVAPPIMIIMMLMACSTKVMGRFTLNVRQRVLGWLATAVMTAAAIGLFATLRS